MRALGHDAQRAARTLDSLSGDRISGDIVLAEALQGIGLALLGIAHSLEGIHALLEDGTVHVTSQMRPLS